MYFCKNENKLETNVQNCPEILYYIFHDSITVNYLLSLTTHTMLVVNVPTFPLITPYEDRAPAQQKQKPIGSVIASAVYL